MVSTDSRCECRLELLGETGQRLLLSILIVVSFGSHCYASEQWPDDFGHRRTNIASNKAVIIGKASWYGQAGQKTATGERLDPNKLTAASIQLPLQSHALVTNLENGRSVSVRINDCGPYKKGRQIDMSKRAARKTRYGPPRHGTS